MAALLKDVSEHQIVTNRFPLEQHKRVRAIDEHKKRNYSYKLRLPDMDGNSNTYVVFPRLLSTLGWYQELHYLPQVSAVLEPPCTQ